MNQPFLFISIALFFLNSFQLRGQTSDDLLNTINSRINNYFIERPHENLYIHTDRSVYFAGDEILFKALLTDAATVAVSDRSNSITLMLTDDSGSEIISATFDVSSGSCAGRFILPSDLKQGKYELIAYTLKDQLITIHKVFNKQIIITDPKTQVMLEHSFEKDAYDPGDEFRLELLAYGFKGKVQDKVNIKYTIYNGAEELGNGEGRTSRNGSFEIRAQLPKEISAKVWLRIEASRKKLSQDMNVAVPLSRMELPAAKENSAVFLKITEVSEDRIGISTQFDPGLYKEDMKVVIGLFRKGLLYWSAPGMLGQTRTLNIPVRRIPEGILDIVLFDSEGQMLSERQVYRERNTQADLNLELSKESYAYRSLVEVELSFDEDFTIPENTELSVSVVPADLLTVPELPIRDYLLIDADIQQDTRSLLLASRTQEEREEAIDAIMQAYDRNGYSWEKILSLDTPGNEDVIVNAGILSDSYIPAEFRARWLNEYVKGIRDRRHPDAEEDNYRRLLDSGMPVLSVIKTMRPYTLQGSKIVFSGTTNSFNFQQGALIVIDGQMMGDNASILNTVSPSQVDKLYVSTDPVDIQKYTGLNAVGVIEVVMKGPGGDSRLSGRVDRDDVIRDSKGSYLPGYPDYSIEKDALSVISDSRSLLYWEPRLKFESDNSARFSFYTSDIPGTYVIKVLGIVGTDPLSLEKEFEVH